MGGQVSVTYAVERWTDYRRDCEPLWREHYDEIAGDKDRTPYGPNEFLYAEMDRLGSLLIITARRDGRMVGYALVNVCQHPNYVALKCGFECAYFLSPSERKGVGLSFRAQTGVQLIVYALNELKARGAVRVSWHTKESRSIAIILKRLGMKKTDELYSMWLDN